LCFEAHRQMHHVQAKFLVLTSAAIYSGQNNELDSLIVATQRFLLENCVFLTTIKYTVALTILSHKLRVNSVCFIV
jgi:hypothetical protein